MFKIPFEYVPSFWGLKGKTREIAKAEYELKGFELDVKLLDIKKEDMSDDEYNRRFIEINKKHNKYLAGEYERALISLIKDDVQRQLATLELEHKEGKISDLEYQKKSATVKKEPWVTVINMNFTKGTALEGSFELDWNEHFVEKLKADGYQGSTPDVIVNQWFMEICRNVAMEEFAETGNFAADSEANLETFRRWNSSQESYPSGRKGYR